MKDFYEIDFLGIESKKSGDAICVRYEEKNNPKMIHVVDGGFQKTGGKVVDHINKYYNNPNFIDHVVVTHPDGDHAGGLRSVLESFSVGKLWMLRPWQYADELIGRFTRFTNVNNLKKRLRKIYPNIDELEQIAIERGISINEPFQRARIGAFIVVSPTKDHYLDMVVNSEKTPESEADDLIDHLGNVVQSLSERAINLIKALWGQEVFSSEETSAENEMSVVQYACLSGDRILLTGDAGRRSLTLGADYLTTHCDVSLPGIDRFQVPHHGSRRNVSTAVLNDWLGSIIHQQSNEAKFTAIVSASKEDKDHPKKAVVRAMIHRGGEVICTEGKSIRTQKNAPPREGWVPVTPLSYPKDQEE